MGLCGFEWVVTVVYDAKGRISLWKRSSWVSLYVPLIFSCDNNSYYYKQQQLMFSHFPPAFPRQNSIIIIKKKKKVLVNLDHLFVFSCFYLTIEKDVFLSYIYWLFASFSLLLAYSSTLTSFLLQFCHPLLFIGNTSFTKVCWALKGVGPWTTSVTWIEGTGEYNWSVCPSKLVT